MFHDCFQYEITCISSMKAYSKGCHCISNIRLKKTAVTKPKKVM